MFLFIHSGQWRPLAVLLEDALCFSKVILFHDQVALIIYSYY